MVSSSNECIKYLLQHGRLFISLWELLGDTEREREKFLAAVKTAK